MNLNHLEAIALVQKLAFTLSNEELDATEVVVIPPFTDLRSVQTLIDGDRLHFAFGAQDLSPYASGAYTGDISGPMLAKLGCGYVLVGHSERRDYHHEGDDTVAAKAAAAVAVGITPIVCVGEHLDVRQAGDAVPHCTSQLLAALAELKDEAVAGVVVAYEPIWAIGTGETATPDDAQEVCTALRSALGDAYGDGVAGSVRMLYGGSVKPETAAELMAEADVDGALVGGASLDAAAFAAIVRATQS
jgi:triosephosphate isomerase